MPPIRSIACVQARVSERLAARRRDQLAIALVGAAGMLAFAALAWIG